MEYKQECVKLQHNFTADEEVGEKRSTADEYADPQQRWFL